MTFSYYTLLTQPLEPLAEPWSNVLDLACEWASGKTTETEAIAEITTNAYEYYGTNRQYNSQNPHTNARSFNLSAFLNDASQDCQDMSAVVQVYTWMLGGTETRVRKIDSTRQNYEDICYTWIHLIGSSGGWSTPYYWNFHQIAWYNNKVYDASIEIDQTNPRIPVNENIEINGSYYNDLHYSGYCINAQYDAWVPKEPFYYTDVY